MSADDDFDQTLEDIRSKLHNMTLNDPSAKPQDGFPLVRTAAGKWEIDSPYLAPTSDEEPKQNQFNASEDDELLSDSSLSSSAAAASGSSSDESGPRALVNRPAAGIDFAALKGHKKHQNIAHEPTIVQQLEVCQI